MCTRSPRRTRTFVGVQSARPITSTSTSLEDPAGAPEGWASGEDGYEPPESEAPAESERCTRAGRRRPRRRRPRCGAVGGGHSLLVPSAIVVVFRGGRVQLPAVPVALLDLVGRVERLVVLVLEADRLADVVYDRLVGW